MAADVKPVNSKISFPKRAIIVPLVLVGIFIITGVLLAFNYWLAVAFGFISLLFLWQFGLEEHQARGLLLLLTTSLFAAILAGSLSLQFSTNVSTAVEVGLIAFFGVIVSFLMLVAVATLVILRWHKKDQTMSTLKAFGYVLTGLLGLLHFSLKIEDGQIKGSDGDKERQTHLGGPGWLTVYPGQVVVLHDWGKITRVVGQGSVMMRREEQVKAIVSLGAKGGANTLENVLTRDRIPLKITVAHAVQVESAADTKTRLGEKPGDKPIGDEYDQCYESIAKLVATRVGVKDNAVDIWDSVKGAITNNIKDVIMSCDFDELFSTGGDSKELGVSLNNRKILEIEKTVLENVKKSGLDKGLVLKVVDINEVHFPDEIKGKLTQQVTAFLDAKIRKNEAQTKADAAEFEAKARETQALAREKAAYFEAQAEVSRGQGKAGYYRHIVQALKEQGLSNEVIGEILQKQASSAALEDEMNRLLQLMVHYVQGEHTGKSLVRDNLSQD